MKKTRRNFSTPTGRANPQLNDHITNTAEARALREFLKRTMPGWREYQIKAAHHAMRPPERPRGPVQHPVLKVDNRSVLHPVLKGART